MKITIVSGTVRDGRESHAVAKYLKNELNQLGHTSSIADIKELNIPFLTKLYRDYENPPEGLTQLKNLIVEADGIIFLSPEYNGSYCGSIKNALDHFKPEYRKKVIGVTTVSAGAMGGIRAAIILQQYVLALGAYPIPRMLTVPNVSSLKDDQGEIIPSKLKSMSGPFLEEFLFLTQAVQQAKE